MRNYVENARLCGNMRKITKCAENNKLLKTVNCAIPHPSHLMGASDLDTKFRIHQLCHAVDGSINLEYGDIILILLAVFECWEDSIRFSKMDIAKN